MTPDESKPLEELSHELYGIQNGFSPDNPNLNVEDARLIGTILCQKPLYQADSQLGMLEAELKSQAFEIAFQWAELDGHVQSDLAMFDHIKDVMSEEEGNNYLALKESDRKQVEKGLKLALLSVLSAEKTNRKSSTL